MQASRGFKITGELQHDSSVPQTEQQIVFRQTWITEADFATIASYGLNHVRIPIGYWSVPVGEDRYKSK